MKGIFLSVVLAMAAILPAAGQRRDSVYTASEQFRFQKLIAPVSLMGVGAVCAFTPGYQHGVNEPVRDWVLSKTSGADNLIDNYIQFAPLAGYAVAAVCGAGEHSFLEQALVGGTSYLLLFLSVQGVKYATANVRPNGAPFSFPSGHTATAFLGAELVRLEYGPWWGLAAYSVAVTTAFLRVWNNWHWTSDLIAGAGFGILCAHAGYWLLPLERKLFHLDHRERPVQLSTVPCVAPTPYGTSYGMSLTLNF